MTANVITFPKPHAPKTARRHIVDRALREIIDSLKDAKPLDGNERYIDRARNLLMGAAEECMAGNQAGLLFQITFALAAIEQDMEGERK